MSKVKSMLVGAKMGLAMLGLISVANAQPATLLPNAKQTFVDQSGVPLAGGSVFTYVPSTTTPKSTWIDPNETTLNANPLTLDSAGRGVIFGQGNYRQVVKDQFGNLVWDAFTSAAGSSIPSGGGAQDTAPVGTVAAYGGFAPPTNWLFAYGQPVSRTTYSVLLGVLTLTNASVTCNTGSPTVNGLADTSQMPIGATIESTCFTAGTTILAKPSGTSLTLSSNGLNNATVSLVVFPWGNGDGSTTFNLPDLRGRTLAGPDAMGGTAASRLTSAYFGASAATPGVAGGSQSHVLTQAELPVTTLTFTGTVAGSLATWGGNQGQVTGGSAFFVPNANNMSFIANYAPSGTINTFGSGAAHTLVQPTLTANYIVKALPQGSGAGGVTSLGGQFGDIVCGSFVTCSGGVISFSPVGASQATFFSAATTTGSANAYVAATPSPVGFSLTAGFTFCSVMNFTNNGPATLNLAGTGAVAIQRRSTSGLNALVGGEIVSGQTYCYQYDGTVYEMIVRTWGSVEQKSANYTANAADGNGDFYVFTAARTLTLPLSTTVANNWTITAFAENGNVTVTPNASDSINGGSVGASVTLTSGTATIITTDGAGHFYVPVLTSGSGTINTGTTGQVPYYPSGGSTVGPLSNVLASSGGDLYLGSGRPWCDVRAQGAKGDGTTDDTAAFNTCRGLLGGINGGTLLVPPGRYCLFSGFSLTVSGVEVRGTSELWSILTTCNHDVTTVTLNGSNDTLSDLTIFGQGLQGDTFSSTASAVVLGSQCIDCHLNRLVIEFGLHSIQWNAGEAYASYITATQNYGSAILYFNGQQGSGVAGGVLYKMKPDQSEYPQGTTPGAGTTFAAWVANHAYTAGTVVFATCQDGHAYYFQAMSSGTSNNSAFPSCKNYGVTFADGSTSWQLNFPKPFYHWQFDTGTNEIYVLHSDTGGGEAGVTMTNTGAGTAPTNIKFTDSNGGGGYFANVWAQVGSFLELNGFHAGNCIAVSCASILFDTGFSGNGTVRGGFATGAPLGVQVAGGAHYLLSNIMATGNTTNAFQVSPNILDFVIEGNDCTGSGSFCVLVQTGTSNNYSVVNNSCAAASCVVDNGSGSRKTVMLNGNN